MDPVSWSQLGETVSDNALNPNLCCLSTTSAFLPSSSSASTSAAASASFGSSLLQTFPAGSSGSTTVRTQNTSANKNNSQDPTMNCLPGAAASGPAASDPSMHIPRRNLSEAFEQLHVAAPMENANGGAGTPGMKQPNGCNDSETGQRVLSSNLISPTGVADLHSVHTAATSCKGKTELPSEVFEGPQTIAALPFFSLHDDLKKDLSQAVINRVSFYGVIHDINKEASAMAANDDSGLNRAASGGQPAGSEDNSEDCSPLVEAVKGPSANPPKLDSNMLQAALIDEERWLLSAIETRGSDEIRPIQACPPTFLQAMGEREYENPLTSLSSGSRTQLWKPSRSWWEAKSGKNPWIEPKSHNKRWRYLWPLIHYHKFLAKCIKKLKRNGVDVKMSVSPVAAFLREEVCAVSDHLASVSLFDSDEWMSCLQHFSGWTDTSPESEANLRGLISKLHLRPLSEHGDVESPLLRSQIDEQYLRAMAAARSQMDMGSESERPKHAHKAPSDNQSSQVRNPAGAPHHYPMEAMPPHMQVVPNQVGGQPPRATGLRRPRLGYAYPHHQWWNQGWQQAHYQHPYGDDASAHSSLSGDAYPEYGMYPGHTAPNGQFYPGPYHHPHAMEHAHANGGYDPNMLSGEAAMYPPMHSPYLDHAGLGFFGHPGVDPSMAYMMHPDEMGGYYGMPPAPKSPQNSPSHQQHVDNSQSENVAPGQQTPFKYDGNKTPRSPYWGHLDTTIAMGLSTPQTHTKEESGGLVSAEDGADPAGAAGAQPLLLRQSQYYGYGPVSNYGPPSPATQFMMSPQANFAMNYGYGYSPTHGHMPTHFKHSPMHGSNHSTNRHHGSSLKKATPGLSPSATTYGRRKPSTTTTATADDENRESPSTVETITESESLSENP